MSTEKRCLGYHCADTYRNNCVHHLRRTLAGELCFQPSAVGEECAHFSPFRVDWGRGPDRETND